MGHHARLRRRPSSTGPPRTAAPPTASPTAGPTAPYWVRLVRSGQHLHRLLLRRRRQLDRWRDRPRSRWARRSTSAWPSPATTTARSTPRPSTTCSLDTAADGRRRPPRPRPTRTAGTTTNLSVLGADLAGESTLTYTWAATTVPAGAATPTFSANGTNAAKNDIVTFHQAGHLHLHGHDHQPGRPLDHQLGQRDGQPDPHVDHARADVRHAPARGATQQFTATALDQFGQALATQPTFTYVGHRGRRRRDGLARPASTRPRRRAPAPTRSR